MARTARSRKPVEELLGLEPVADKPAPRNTRLWRKPREIEKAPAIDRKAVIKLVDGLVADPAVCGGRVCVKGTRIQASLIPGAMAKS